MKRILFLCTGNSCPLFPVAVFREHWALSDPAGVEASEEAILEDFRSVRDELEKRVRALLASG